MPWPQGIARGRSPSTGPSRRLLRLRPVADRGLLRRQQALKGFIGTANIDTNSRLCMASSVAGHKRAFGSDTVPGIYEDLELADLVVLVGSNLAWCHPVLFQRLEAAKRARPDLKIVVIDPRRTATCDIADLHLPLSAGQRRGAVQRPAGLLAAARRRTRDFVERHTTGLEAALAAARRQRSPRRLRPAGRPTLATFFDWFAAHRADGHALFAGREPVERRHRQGQRDHQLPPADRPHRPARHGTVLAHRPAQRDGRARSRRACQHARRAHGSRAGRHRPRRPLLARAAHGARPGLKAVDLFEAVGAARSRRCGSWRPIRSPACPTPTRCARRCRAASSSSSPMRSRADRHRRCLPHTPAGARLGGEGRHRHQFRTPHLAPAAVPAAARRGAAGLVDHRRGRARGWASARPSPGTAPPRSSASMPRCRPSRTTARASSISAPGRHRRRGLRRPGAGRLAGGATARSSPTAASSTPTGARASCTAAARARVRAGRRAAAAAQHRPGARPVAHHDPHRKVRAAGRPPARAVRRDASGAMRRRAASPMASSPRDERAGAAMVRACSTAAVRPGVVFVPMHWTAQFARRPDQRGGQPGGGPDFGPARAQAHAGRNPSPCRVAWHDSRSPPGDVARSHLLDADQGRGLSRLAAGGRTAARKSAPGAGGRGAREQSRSLA